MRVKTILVVANETIGGRSLLEKVREIAAEADGLRVVVVVPRTRPRHGNVIYDDAVFQAAQARIDLARQFMRGEGIDVVGEVGDPDPYTATIDAVLEYEPDEVVVSTYPETTSGWLRRDLIERIQDGVGPNVAVQHVVSDIEAEGLPFGVTLVVANRTASSPELLDALKERAQQDEQGRHLFIAVVPQEGGEGIHVQRASAHLAQFVDRVRSAGLVAAGLIGPPDPYVATMNALQYFRVDDIVVSTLPATRSGWQRQDLVERVRKTSGKPVEHVVAQPHHSTTAA
jgi:hypothetical protein